VVESSTDPAGMDAKLASRRSDCGEAGFKFTCRTRSPPSRRRRRRQGDDRARRPARGADARAEVVLVAIGRRPYTQGLGLEALGVGWSAARSRSTTIRTNAPGVYAIGDVVRGRCWRTSRGRSMALAEILAASGHVNYDVIPGVVYTIPEWRASQKRGRLKAAGSLRGRQVPFTANGRARRCATRGFVKVWPSGERLRARVHIVGFALARYPRGGVLMESAVPPKTSPHCHAIRPCRKR